MNQQIVDEFICQWDERIIFLFKKYDIDTEILTIIKKFLISDPKKLFIMLKLAVQYLRGDKHTYDDIRENISYIENVFPVNDTKDSQVSVINMIIKYSIALLVSITNKQMTVSKKKEKKENKRM